MRRIAGTIAIAVLALAFLGCPEKKGPFEKVGEELDEATEDVRDAVEDAAEEIDD